jgi:hypothetical protein
MMPENLRIGLLNATHKLPDASSARTRQSQPAGACTPRAASHRHQFTAFNLQAHPQNIKQLHLFLSRLQLGSTQVWGLLVIPTMPPLTTIAETASLRKVNAN